MKTRTIKVRDEFMQDIADMIRESEKPDTRARLLTMYRENLWFLYIRLDDEKSIDCYIRHMCQYMELNGGTI